MASNFDVEVVGIDLSVNMISFALEKSIGLKCAVEFEVADCTTKKYPDNTFDVIYSRDTILHIQVRPHPLLRPCNEGEYCYYINLQTHNYPCLTKNKQTVIYDLDDILTIAGQACIIPILLQVVEAGR